MFFFCLVTLWMEDILRIRFMLWFTNWTKHNMCYQNISLFQVNDSPREIEFSFPLHPPYNINLCSISSCRFLLCTTKAIMPWLQMDVVGDIHSSIQEPEWIFHYPRAMCIMFVRCAWLSISSITTLFLPDPVGSSDDPYSRCQHVASVGWSRVNTVRHTRLPGINTRRRWSALPSV